MFGRFLEISLATPDIPVSAAFYQRLGFHDLATSDAYAHRYGVYSDGRVHLGLHEGASAGAALAFVLPELASQLGRLRAAHFLRPRAKHPAFSRFRAGCAPDRFCIS